jgi:hypothetical protein
MKASGRRHETQNLPAHDPAHAEFVPLERVLTVFVGFWYWAQIYVAADANRDGVSPWSTIGLFLLIWIVSWGILYYVITKAPSGHVLGVITAVVVLAASWLFVTYTPVGGDDKYVLSIGVGGGFGITMLMNVWGIIWRNNKQVIQGTLAGTPPMRQSWHARRSWPRGLTSSGLCHWYFSWWPVRTTVFWEGRTDAGVVKPRAGAGLWFAGFVQVAYLAEAVASHSLMPEK